MIEVVDGGPVDRARALRMALRGLVAELEPDMVTVREAPVLYDELCGLERLVCAAKALVARRVAESDTWRRRGHRSAGEYMAKLAGSSVHSGRAMVEMSKRLVDAPETEAALRRGELSAQQADVITDAVSRNPAAESKLLDLAAYGSLAELREESARAKAAADPDPDATHQRIHRDRVLRQRLDAEGAWCLYGRATADVGAEFDTVLAPLIDEQFAKARAEGRQESRAAYALDALREALRICWDARHGVYDPDDYDRNVDEVASLCGDEAGGGRRCQSERVGDEAPSGASSTDKSARALGSTASVSDPARAEVMDSGDDSGNGSLRRDRRSSRGRKRKRRRRTNPRHLALIKVDLAALVRGCVAGDELSEIAGVGPVPVCVLRDKLGDSIAKLVITNGRDVVNVTHLGRGPTLVQRIAVLWRSHTCSVEGCARTRIEFDHRIDWATTRHTRVDELDGLCHFHHGLKTRLGWALVVGNGKRAMVPPDDPRHPTKNQAATTPAALRDSA